MPTKLGNCYVLHCWCFKDYRQLQVYCVDVRSIGTKRTEAPTATTAPGECGRRLPGIASAYGFGLEAVPKFQPPGIATCFSEFDQLKDHVSTSQSPCATVRGVLP